MNIKEYKNNPDLAYATEVLNANAKTPEELLQAMSKAKKVCLGFKSVLSKYEHICHELEILPKDIAYRNEILPLLEEFKQSRIAQLIGKFTENNSDKLMSEIEREIELSGNPFDISIEEGIYDVGYNGIFRINSIGVFYEFDNFNIDEDIESFKIYNDGDKKEIIELTAEKAKLEQEYDL